MEKKIKCNTSRLVLDEVYSKDLTLSEEKYMYIFLQCSAFKALAKDEHSYRVHYGCVFWEESKNMGQIFEESFCWENGPA